MNPTRKIYYLSHCDTCLRILHELRSLDEFVFQDIKEDPITEEELETLKQSTGKYELLFNKRAKLYKERNLNKQSLTEEHYTFLKRPIVVIGERVISGNATKIIKDARKLL